MAENILVVVESPSKAKTIQKYLGDGYRVESSVGHIRDLPKSAQEIPPEFKSLPWSRLGINVEHEFEPIYVVSKERRTVVQNLKSLSRSASRIILATDDDREGESIAWHLYQELKPKAPVDRIVFREITREAISQAVLHPRTIDHNLVEAQEARRALDRLYGYEVSPVLWKKIAPRLSAGRVQSVATRMMVERERERMRFTSAQYWGLEAVLKGESALFPAHLIELAGVRLATGKDFTEKGTLKDDKKVFLLLEKEAKELADILAGGRLVVRSVEERPFTQRPYAPFITSTLQQEGSRKLGWSAKRTMQVAQKLYENGHITYMRTDSTTLSGEAIEAARRQVATMYGNDYLYPTPRRYDKKSKNAQEAHEAIRPAGSQFSTPEMLKSKVGDDEWRLYDLIWKRTVASQMKDATGRRTSVRLAGFAGEREVVFGTSGQVIDFPGFLRAYVEGADDPEAALDAKEVFLPPLSEGQEVAIDRLTPKGHQTQPPARFTEASLVQGLEAAGIGRPSTYASILSTIQERGYVFKKGNALVPTWTGFVTVQLLETYFFKLIDYGFTAHMEEELDEIAGGRQRRVPYLKAFYSGSEGLKGLIESRLEEIDPRQTSVVKVPCLEETEFEVRVGKFGPYLKRGEQSVSLPETLAPDEMTLEKAEEFITHARAEHLGQDPESGLWVSVKVGRYGPYIQLGEGKEAKYASLFPGELPESVTFERALHLLSLPRKVGVISGQDVWAKNGRYGPYLERGTERRNLDNHGQLFTITLEEAEIKFQEPPSRGRSSIGTVLKTFEYADRTPILIKLGRFGPYLTDGSLNAWLRKTEDPASLDETGIREIFEERGKPPKDSPKTAKPVKKSKASSSKGAARASTKTPKKGEKSKGSASIPWEILKGHVDLLSDIERQVILDLRDRKKKPEEVALDLGLPVSKVKGMALQISKKLHQAQRSSAV